MSSSQSKINSKNIVRTLIVLVVLATLYYIYLINATTINAATAEKNSEKIADLQSEISELEFNFIELNKSLNQEDVAEFDLTQEVNSQEVSYITVGEDTRLTFNAQE